MSMIMELKYKYKKKNIKKIFFFNFKKFFKLEKDTQIQIWKDTSILPEHAKWSDYLSNITRDGYKVILSSPWYINFIKYGYEDWYRFYNVEPFTNFTGIYLNYFDLIIEN